MDLVKRQIQGSGAIKNLTFIIPTRNRTDYLSRNVSYLQKSNLNFVIVDASRENKKNEICVKDDQYLHLPDLSLIERIKSGLKAISTEYAMVLPDDDFVDYFSVQKLILDIEKFSNCVAATGFYMDCWLDRRKNKLYFRPVAIKSILNYRPHRDIQLRVEHWANQNHEFLYSVFRIEEVQRYFHKNEIPEWAKRFENTSVYFSLVLMLQGEVMIKKIPLLYRSATKSTHDWRIFSDYEIKPPTKKQIDKMLIAETGKAIGVDKPIDLAEKIVKRERVNIWRNSVGKFLFLRRHLPRNLLKVLGQIRIIYWQLSEYISFAKWIYLSPNFIEHKKVYRQILRAFQKSDKLHLDLGKKPMYLPFHLKAFFAPRFVIVATMLLLLVTYKFVMLIKT